jgi:hypothetical protein
MTYETTTSLSPAEVLSQATTFFATRVPATSAFAEKQGSGYVVLRGQGGEEVVFAAVAVPGGASVRGSTMMFGQQVNRFFTTLPPVRVVA